MKKYFWLLIILILGAFLRYYHNTNISLWHDEALSALLIKYPWEEMMHRIGLDVHPPAYYVFLRFWHYIFGDSLLSLRSFSVFFGVGTIWVVWLFVKEAFKNSKVALLACGLVAVNYFQIIYATEARMYTMGAFFAVLASYFLVKALHYQTAINEAGLLQMPNLPETKSAYKKMFWSYLGFSLSIIVIIYTHYYLLFVAMAICFYGLVYLFMHHRFTLKSYVYILTSYFIILVSYIPWLKTFFFQYNQVGSGYWIPPMSKWSIPSTLYTLFVGFSHEVLSPSVQKLLAVTTILILFVIYQFLKKTQSFHKWLVLMVALAPFLGSILFLIIAKLKGSDSSVYLVRYFIFTSAFFSVIMGIWLFQIKSRALFLLLTVGYTILNLVVFINYWQDIDIKNRPGMNGAVKYLQANMEPNNKLYASSSYIFFNLKYYSSKLFLKDEPLLYSSGKTSIQQMSHYQGTAILTNEDLLSDFNQGVNIGDKVWLVWTNSFNTNKPEIPVNWTQITEKEFPEVRPYLGKSVFVSEFVVR